MTILLLICFFIIILLIIYFLFIKCKKLKHEDPKDSFWFLGVAEGTKKLILQFNEYALDQNKWSQTTNFEQKYIDMFKNSNMYKSQNYFLTSSQTISIPYIILYNNQIYNLTSLAQTKPDTKLNEILLSVQQPLIGINKTLPLKLNKTYTNDKYEFQYGPINNTLAYHSNKSKTVVNTDGVFLHANTNRIWKLIPEFYGRESIVKYNNLNFCLLLKASVVGQIYKTSKMFLSSSQIIDLPGLSKYVKDDKYNISMLNDLEMTDSNVSRIFYYNDAIDETGFAYVLEFEYLAYALNKKPIDFLVEITGKVVDECTKIYTEIKRQLKLLFNSSFEYKEYINYEVVNNKFIQKGAKTPNEDKINVIDDLIGVCMFSYSHLKFFYITSVNRESLKFVPWKDGDVYKYKNENNEIKNITISDDNLKPELEVLQKYIVSLFNNKNILTDDLGINNIVVYNTIYSKLSYVTELLNIATPNINPKFDPLIKPLIDKI